MLKSFACKETQKIWEGIFSKKFPEDIQIKARRKLIVIDAASTLLDLVNPPANFLKKMKGNKSDFCSIRINDQWRIVFEFFQDNAYNVKIIDYH